MHTPNDVKNQMFEPGYTRTRILTLEEAAAEMTRRETGGDEKWFGIFYKFPISPFDPIYTPSPEEVDILKQDIMDFLHLQPNKENFPLNNNNFNLYESAHQVKFMILLANVLDYLEATYQLDILFEIYKMLFEDQNFCQDYELLIMNTEDGLAPSNKSEIQTKLQSIYNILSPEDISTLTNYELFISLINILANTKAFCAIDPAEANVIKEDARTQLNKILKKLDGQNKSVVADAFRQVWINFSVKEFEPPTKESKFLA